MATGANWPDALAGGALAGALGAPLVLVRPDSVPAVTVQALYGRRPWFVGVLGGPLAVLPAVATEVRLEPLVEVPWVGTAGSEPPAQVRAPRRPSRCRRARCAATSR